MDPEVSGGKEEGGMMNDESILFALTSTHDTFGAVGPRQRDISGLGAADTELD